MGQTPGECKGICSGEATELRKSLTNVKNHLKTVTALWKAREDQVRHQKVELALHRSELHAKNNALREAEARVSSIQVSLTRKEGKLTIAKEKSRHLHTLLRYERRKVDRAKALGSMRLHARQKPVESLHQYNSQAMYRRNNTEAFIAAKCNTSADTRFFMRKARIVDSSGVEGKRRAELIKHDEEIVQIRRNKDAQKKASEIQERQRIDGRALVLDEENLKTLTARRLDDQLAVHHRRDPRIPAKSTFKTWQAKFEAVKAAVANVRAEEGLNNSKNKLYIRIPAGQRGNNTPSLSDSS
ncbi:hypothetical protein BJ138DRAFT_1167479 [Hygrophoropsis aurantiaca]|uniref:Uncharacterized protein n=1 Tax=Hygrophoropsis aurantiaca TaxID=72124 RepID=A0ACB7ZRZ7_9AGAM|nr:hypothetical protein BJ138DRAFT_1167479 [Hygrophoropsis aurantiaca]